jgi:hypothetical protein
VPASLERLFVLLGLQPGVLHSVLCAWLTRYRPRVVILVATSKDIARRAIELASSCPCPGADKPPLALLGKVELATRILSRGDYDSMEAIAELRELFDEERLGEGDAVGVTGGRKLASIAAALLAATRGARVGYTLIPSKEYERLRREVERKRRLIKGLKERDEKALKEAFELFRDWFEETHEIIAINTLRAAAEKPPVWWQWLMLIAIGVFGGIGLGILISTYLLHGNPIPVQVICR